MSTQAELSEAVRSILRALAELSAAQAALDQNPKQTTAHATIDFRCERRPAMVVLRNISLLAMKSWPQEKFPPNRREGPHEDYRKNEAGATKSHGRSMRAADRGNNAHVSLEMGLRNQAHSSFDDA
jgi:hypothetical protein